MLDCAEKPHATLPNVGRLTAATVTATRCEDANRISNATPNKAKTILNWLKSATKSFDSGESRSRINGATSVDEWPRPAAEARAHRAKSLPPAPLPTSTSTDASLHEFRGVQSLRHLWNKRISASEESTRRSKSLGGGTPNNKLTKSIGCLVNATNAADASSVHSKIDALNERFQETQRKRAQSLHDCTQLHLDETSAAAVTQTAQLEASIDDLHREKDNFYKYKTAEQAAKHIAREARVRAKTRRVTAGIVSDSVAEDERHFPAVKASERGERIHWLKRQDIVLKRNHSPEDSDPQMATTNARVVCDVVAPVATLSADDDLISDGDGGSSANNACQQQVPTLATAPSPAAAAPTSDSRSVSSDTDTLTATNSPQHASRTRGIKRETTALLANSKRGSTDSTASSSTNGGRSARRTTSSSSSSAASARKYSFKTHSRSYHAPRRMTNRDSGAAGSGAGGGVAGVGANFSMVAKLTQQFNEIIQKDKKLLEEVKRKNGVLMSRGGHVYKVVETSSIEGAKKSSPSVSRNSSRAKDVSTRSSMVQRNIRKFESSGSVANSEKPAVPAKSAQVLRKLNEHNKALQANLNLPASGKRLPLSLPPTTATAAAHAELQMKLELKKAQLAIAISPPLEVVKEEVKTPLDTEEQSIVAIAAAATSASNVSNGETTASTFHCAAGGGGGVDCLQNISSAEANIANRAKTDTNGTAYGPAPAAAHMLPQLSKADNALAGAADVAQKGANADGENLSGGVVQAEQIVETIKSADHNKTEQQTQQQQQQQNDDASNKTNGATEAIGTNRSNVRTDVPTNASDAITATAITLTAIEQKVAASDDDLDGDANEEKAKQRKHKYAKIYEKFRFRSPFGGGHGKKLSPSKTAEPLEAPPLLVAEPDAKIRDALEAVDQKLKGLAEDGESAAAIVLCENDDFEQRVLPNSSFVFQASAKQVTNNQLLVTQAVNVALVNSIEGEQMIMEQKELQLQRQQLLQKQQLLQQQRSAEETPMLVLVDASQGAAQKRERREVEKEFIYEPIVPATEPKTEQNNQAITTHSQISFLYKSSEALASTTASSTTKDEITLSITTELVDDIYQTVEEVIKLESHTVESTASSNVVPSDYESIAGSCEQAPPATSSSSKMLYDGYEICEPPPDPTTTTIPTLNQQISRNTNDELPELPKPKRRLPKSPMPGKRPPKPAALPSSSSTAPCGSTASPLELLHDNDDHHYYADDENIYDTIKGSHCYESLHIESLKSQKSSFKSADTVSLTSNCYESIAQYRRVTTAGSHLTGSSSGSISSDHKTNSLYEVSLAAGIMYAAGSLGYDGAKKRHALATGGTQGATSDVNSDENANSTQYCYTASSDNSDDWVDISDGDGDSKEQVKQQFIVVRERSKVHRSPDWSKRVRDKRLHQKKAMSYIEDDSDHYYETLSPLSNKRHSTQMVQRTNSHHKRNQDLPKYALAASQRSKPYSASAHALGGAVVSDDYDSFDTDTDEIYETEENLKNQNNDSGVDIRQVKLPETPSSTNQVYAIVRKLKNFISNKKSPGSTSKYGGSQQKLYENSTQFYVSGNIYENTPKTKPKAHKTQPPKKSPSSTPLTLTQTPDDLYENTEFHTPPAVHVDGKPFSTSEKNLCTPDAKNEPANSSSATMRSKSKSGKSFKLRLRKSLVGASFDTKQLSTLTPTRSTFYIEDPTYGGSGELDSGFSEKASSGDLPTSPSVPTPEAQKFSTVARKTKKETKSANMQRRRTTIGIRPHDPPPPPPVAASTTSWYTECGVFKQSTTTCSPDEQSLSGSKSTQYSQLNAAIANGSSWYTEAGLYQTSGVSVASSSGSSGVSTGNEGGVCDEPHSMFQNEPLYQIYNDEKIKSITCDMEDHDSSTDGYEEIGQSGIGSDKRTGNEDLRKSNRPSAFQLIEPKNGPSRTLWSEIPEVINSCILPTLTPRERSLQEAKFEIITSEASYLKSLNLLSTHFMNHPVFRDTNVVDARDRKALFAYIVPVHECSDRLLTELESCWQDSIMLLGMSKRIYAIAEKYFHVYIAFCEHQGRMDRTLRRLKEAKGIFSQNLDLLEASPTCCGLNLHSFLMLPMQRITRLPLLIDAVFSKVSQNDDEYESWKMTLAIMNKIVAQCNEAANRCEQAYEIERISRQLEFPSTIRALAIAPAGVSALGSKPRFLVKKGELTHLIWRGDEAKLTFGKKLTKSNIFAFLFSDLLVLTKRKGEEHFTVFDYCPRNLLTISSGDMRDISQTHRNLILMTLLENHEGKTVELVLSCASVSEQERWLQAVRPPEPEAPGEKLYAPWDCPQVIAKHTYDAKEPDALNLEVGDVVNVTRKLPDGWYHGERIRGGAVGWFPGSYTEEVNSPHVRARNLKQRQRLLTFTATYLESQKRK